MVNGLSEHNLLGGEKRNFDVNTNTSFLMVVFIWGGCRCTCGLHDFSCVNITFHYTLEGGQAVVGRGGGEARWASLSGYRFHLEGEGASRVDGAVVAQQCKLLAATALKPVRTAGVCYICFTIFKR